MREQMRLFFLAPASARPIAVLRLSVSLVLIVQALSVAPIYFELYGSQGILQGTLGDFFTPGVPSVADLVRWLRFFGPRETPALVVVGASYLFSLVWLSTGKWTRAAAALAWFLHLALTQSHTTAYGVDSFAHILLFYLIFVPSGLVMAPSSEARLSLRLLQIHLAIAYLSSGIEKGLGPQWWNGEAIWRSINLPVYWQYDLTWLAGYPWLPKILGWGTLVAEALYPIFIFPARTRWIWIGLVVSLHFGIALFLGLHLFSILMSLMTLSLFGISAEPGAVYRTASIFEFFKKLRHSVMYARSTPAAERS